MYVNKKCAGKAARPPRHQFPVEGPLQHVGVDVLQIPPTVNGNLYVVVVMDYLTKWPEAVATANQTAEPFQGCLWSR